MCFSLEYRALGRLVKLVLGYYFGIVILFTIVMVGYFYSGRGLKFLGSTTQAPWWNALVLTFSVFNNIGFSPTNDSLARWSNDAFVLIIFALLILLGNTA